MTEQEAFDKAVRGIISQGGPSTNKSGMCMYRSPEGKRCAIGWLIPDSVYTESMEGSGIFDALLEEVNKHLGLPVYFLNDLQGVHDSAAIELNFFGHFKDGLEEFALDYSLDPSVLSEIPLDG